MKSTQRSSWKKEREREREREREFSWSVERKRSIGPRGATTVHRPAYQSIASVLVRLCVVRVLGNTGARCNLHLPSRSLCVSLSSLSSVPLTTTTTTMKTKTKMTMKRTTTTTTTTTTTKTTTTTTFHRTYFCCKGCARPTEGDIPMDEMERERKSEREAERGGGILKVRGVHWSCSVTDPLVFSLSFASILSVSLAFSLLRRFLRVTPSLSSRCFSSTNFASRSCAQSFRSLSLHRGSPLVHVFLFLTFYWISNVLPSPMASFLFPLQSLSLSLSSIHPLSSTVFSMNLFLPAVSLSFDPFVSSSFYSVLLQSFATRPTITFFFFSPNSSSRRTQTEKIRRGGCVVWKWSQVRTISQSIVYRLIHFCQSFGMSLFLRSVCLLSKFTSTYRRI